MRLILTPYLEDLWEEMVGLANRDVGDNGYPTGDV